MQRTIHNPWAWSEGLGFDQAVEVRGGERHLYCAGQASIDEEGNPVTGDYAAQFDRALDNLLEVLRAADMEPSDVVRVHLYTTDVGQHFAAIEHVAGRVADLGIRAAGMLTQVTALAFPELLLEIEATAVA